MLCYIQQNEIHQTDAVYYPGTPIAMLFSFSELVIPDTFRKPAPYTVKLFYINVNVLSELTLNLVLRYTLFKITAFKKLYQCHFNMR